MKIIYLAPKYNYGDPKKGFSFEHHNFWPALSDRAVYFPTDVELKKFGRDRLNKKLLELTKQVKPDLLFCILFTDEIKKETILKITQSGVTTFNWFCDDNWRFDTFSKFYAPCFNWVATTYPEVVEKYNKIGYKNVILTQWAANELIYKPQKSQQRYEVSFVGKAHSNRKKIINFLDSRSIKVDCYGEGWPNGRVHQEKMLEIFSNSKINLNFAESSFNLNWKFLIKRLFYRRLNGSFCFQKVIDFKKPGRQIKARNFEIPVCGGFLLTQYSPGLENYFQFEKEVSVFDSLDELALKIKYYLSSSKKREIIADAGYRRVLEEHTYRARFKKIFEAMRLPALE